MSNDTIKGENIQRSATRVWKTAMKNYIKTACTTPQLLNMSLHASKSSKSSSLSSAVDSSESRRVGSSASRAPRLLVALSFVGPVRRLLQCKKFALATQNTLRGLLQLLSKMRLFLSSQIAYQNFKEKDLRGIMSSLCIFLVIGEYNYNS